MGRVSKEQEFFGRTVGLETQAQGRLPGMQSESQEDSAFPKGEGVEGDDGA